MTTAGSELKPNDSAGGNAGMRVSFAFENRWPGVPYPGWFGLLTWSRGVATL